MFCGIAKVDLVIPDYLQGWGLPFDSKRALGFFRLLSTEVFTGHLHGGFGSSLGGFFFLDVLANNILLNKPCEGGGHDIKRKSTRGIVEDE